MIDSHIEPISFRHSRHVIPQSRRYHFARPYYKSHTFASGASLRPQQTHLRVRPFLDYLRSRHFILCTLFASSQVRTYWLPFFLDMRTQWYTRALVPYLLSFTIHNTALSWAQYALLTCLQVTHVSTQEDHVFTRYVACSFQIILPQSCLCFYFTRPLNSFCL